MPVPIISASGAQYGAGVDQTNRLMVVGSIVTMPTISVTAVADPATTKVGGAGLGSASLVGAYDGADNVQPMRIVGSHLMVAGSISSMPSLSVSAGSQSYLFASGTSFRELISTPESALITTVSGGVTITGSIMIGSVSVQADSVYIQSGDNISITNLPAQMGSVGVTALPGDLGSVVVSSSSLLGVSGGIFIDGKLIGSFAPKGIGSVVIKSAPLIGISGAIFDSGDITGSVVLAATSSRLGISGIVEVSNVVQTAGSIYSMPPLSAAADPATTEFGKEGLGSAGLIGGLYNGSVFPARIDIGSYLMTAGSIVTLPSIVGVSGDYFQDILGSVQVNTGSVRSQSVQVTSPWIILGSVYQTNSSEITTGSENYNYVQSGNGIWIEEPEYRKVLTSGVLPISGVVNQGTSPWIISGTSTIAGSAFVTGSVVISESNRLGVSGEVEVSNLGSQSYLWGKSGADYYELSSTEENALITITSGTQTAWSGIGSVTGNVGVSGTLFHDMLGSTYITNADDIGGFNGSESWIKAGSVRIVSQADTSRQITAGSMILQDTSGTLLFFKGGMVPGSIISMPTTTISGTATIEGSAFITGSINIATDLASIGSWTGYTGSIWSMPAISAAADPATTKLAATGLGSVSLAGGYDGAANVQALRIVNGSHLMIAGSISSMPSVNATNESVAKDGTETLGSSTQIGGMMNGSVFPARMYLGSHLMIAGSISSMPAVNATNESVVEIGKEHLGSGGVVGGVSNGSMFPFIMALGSYALTAGSITSLPIVGISGATDIGSVVISSAPLIGVSGLIFTDGKMTGSMAMKGIGSVIIQSSNIIGISGAIFDSGKITGSVVLAATSSKLGISGGVDQLTPSIPFVTEQVRDIFGFSGVSLIGSFTGSRIITPGLGSSLFLKGFNISAELASKCRIFFSGGTPKIINTFNLPNSGTVAMNLMGMEPSGATNQPITIGKFDTGSIHATVFSRDAL